MGLIFSELSTDKGNISINYTQTDGKAFPYFAFGFGDLSEYEPVKNSGIWLYPVERLFFWQPSKRLLKVLAGVKTFLNMNHSKLSDELLYLEKELPDIIAAASKAVDMNAAEIRIGQASGEEKRSIIEKARSGRSRYRKCKNIIPKGELRFGRGNVMFSAYSWYHLECGTVAGRDFIRAAREYGKNTCFSCLYAVQVEGNLKIISLYTIDFKGVWHNLGREVSDNPGNLVAVRMFETTDWPDYMKAYEPEFRE
jgi:hypothetical protein